MINVIMDESDLLFLLTDRVEYWSDDRDVIELYHRYYEELIIDGVFDGITLDIKSIVDNDYINNYNTTCLSEYKNSDDYDEDRIVYADESLDLCLLTN